MAGLWSHRALLLMLLGIAALGTVKSMTPRAGMGASSLQHRRHLLRSSQPAQQLRSAQGDHTQESSPQPGIQIAARQALFDYATQQGLAVLVQRVTGLTLPDVTKTFHVPLAGDFELRLYNIRVQEFSAPHEDARLVILNNYFNLWVEQVSTHVTFDWHWEKPGLGIQGTGDGELTLRNGVIQYVFSVAKDNETARPKLEVKVADSSFESTEIKIHSFSADWLYQAVLSLFNERINTAINRGIARAMSEDVPAALDGVLASLPTHIDVKGLPFATAFDYSIYTLSYVLLKGYGEVEAASSAASGAAGAVAGAATPGSMPGITSQRAEAEAEAQKQAQGTGSVPQRPQHGAASAAALASELQRCPFAASELPVGADALASDPRMLTLYVHESLLNCLAWGMYNVGSLQYSVVDGSVPKLHLTTDLMAMLIPALPKTYPHQPMRIDAEALAAPTVSFKPEGVTIDASYRTTIYVDNQTLGVPLVAQLDAHVTITAAVGWDTTTILSATVEHTLVQSTMTVPVQQWDTTVAWFIQNYAGLYPLQFLVNQFVKTPVTSLVALVNAAGASLNSWFALSGDVQLQIPAEAVARLLRRTS